MGFWTPPTPSRKHDFELLSTFYTNVYAMLTDRKHEPDPHPVFSGSPPGRGGGRGEFPPESTEREAFPPGVHPLDPNPTENTALD